MHLFDIRRSRSVTELWKSVERGSTSRSQLGEGHRNSVSSITTEKPALSYNNQYEVEYSDSHGQWVNENNSTGNPTSESPNNEELQPRTEPESLLSAFEAEIAKMLEEGSAAQPANEQADNSSSAQSHTTQPGSMPPTWPSDLVANILQTVVGKMDSLRSELGSKVPEIERHLRNAHNAIPGDVASSAQTALNAMQSQAQNLAQLLQNASDASGQAAERVREAELRSAEQIIDGLEDMVQGLEDFGKTLFAAFEAEFGQQNNNTQAEATGSTGPTQSECVQQPVESTNISPNNAQSEAEINQELKQQSPAIAEPKIDSLRRPLPPHPKTSWPSSQPVSQDQTVAPGSTPSQSNVSGGTLFSSWPNRPAFAPLTLRPVPPPSVPAKVAETQQVQSAPISFSAAPIDSGSRPATLESNVQNPGPATNSLFIGNVGYQVTEKVIGEVFASKGCSAQIHLPKDSFTGRHVGFGYARFESSQYAKAALESLQGIVIDGHSINLEYSDNSPIDAIQTQPSLPARPTFTDVPVDRRLRHRKSWHPGTLQPREVQPVMSSSRDDLPRIFSGNSRGSSLRDRRRELNQPRNSVERSVHFDHPEESPEFAARYPSLLPTRSTDELAEAAPKRSMTFSPNTEMARFPPVSQLDAHLLANQYRSGHREDNSGSQARSEAPPLSTTNEIEPVDQPTFQQPRPEPIRDMGRAQFLGRKSVGSQSLRRRHHGYPAGPRPQSLRARRTDTLPGSFPVDDAPGSVTRGYTDTLHEDMQTAIRHSIIDNCVDTLTTMGYEEGLDGGKQRLKIYAEAVDGKVSDAIDMIEEERRAYEGQDSHP
jgi:RNA recognition motif-containing protein/uncharacterized protein YukE